MKDTYRKYEITLWNPLLARDYTEMDLHVRGQLNMLLWTEVDLNPETGSVHACGQRQDLQLNMLLQGLDLCIWTVVILLQRRHNNHRCGQLIVAYIAIALLHSACLLS